MRILLAEDELVSRLLLTETLRNQGHEVAVADNGQHAWEMLQRDHFPLLISDWIMPDLDGLELCRRVRARDHSKYTYFILITALHGKKNYLEGMAAGADDFITKPFDPDELAARLRVADRLLHLQQEVKQLQGLLPICSYCKKIRDDRNVWTAIEVYVGKQTDASFSHGICPACYEEQVVPQLDAMDKLKE